MSEAILNCWEFKKCGREPGGARVSELGVCPAATEEGVNGANRGTNGGRACWVVAGTFCGGKAQGTFARKFASCLLCEFYRGVVIAEGTSFQGARELRGRWTPGGVQAGSQESEVEELVIGISDVFDVLVRVAAGDYTAKATEDAGNPVIQSLGRTVNETVGRIRTSVDALQTANRELDQKLELIERQRAMIHDLSTPILQLWDNVLALPVIGVVDSRRSAEIMERLLMEITARQSRFVILDITGVEVVDTRTADHFIKMVQAVQLLGSKCVITGIRPAVAQTLVEIGVDLSSVATLRNLREGLRECIRQMGATAVPAAAARG